MDEALSKLIEELPGLFGWFWEISYDLLIGWALILLIVALVARRRKRLLFEELFAAALALVVALLVGRRAGRISRRASVPSPPRRPARLPRRPAGPRDGGRRDGVAAPQPPLRFAGRCVLVLGALGGIALGATLPIGMVAGLLVGAGSAAIVHLVLGSPAGRLSLEQIGAPRGPRRRGDRPRAGALETPWGGARDRVVARRPEPAGEGVRPRRLGRPAPHLYMVVALAAR